MELTFTEATSDVIPSLIEILNGAVNYKVSHGDHSWGFGVFTTDEVKHQMANGSVYVAQLGEELVGTVTLTWKDELVWGKDHGQACYVHRLAVKEAVHGHGLGKQIIQWVAEHALSEGVNLLRLDCDSLNKGLCDYYENQGFIRVITKKIPEHKFKTALYERKI